MTLDYALAISTPTGWLELENEAGGYGAHAETTGTRSVTWRKREVASEWVEGSFTVGGVRDNITENVSVWVTGATPAELHTRLKAVTDALEQLSFQIRQTWGNQTETWSCFAAGYTVTTDQPMRFALHALVQAQVPRLPSAVTA